MARKRTAGPPTLFGEAGPTNGAYGLAAPRPLPDDLGEPVRVVPEPDVPLPPPPGPPWYRPGPHAVRDRMLEIAAEVVAEYRAADARRIAELEDAVRRAIFFLGRENWDAARIVLEGAITPEPGRSLPPDRDDSEEERPHR